MKIITKSYNIYEFDELPEESKKAAIEKEKELIRETDIDIYLENEITEFAKKVLKKNFDDRAILKDVLYDFSYCQGSGAMIEFDLVYNKKRLEVRHDNLIRYTHANSFEILEKESALTEREYRNLFQKIYYINKVVEKFGYNFIERDREDEAIESLKYYLFYENGEKYGEVDSIE